MVGTGKGALQPTKPITTDDFVSALALPGYFSFQSSALAENTDQPLYRVPDGLTVEVVDFGVTALQTDIVDTAATTETSIKLDAVTAGVTVNVMSTAAITGGGGVTTTLAQGKTASISRKSVSAGDTGYAFTAASIALSNQYGSGTCFQFTLDDTHGTGSTGEALIWIRLKFVSKDTGTI